MKIFCIGLSKTGTSSLTSALNLLGFKAVHWDYTRKTFEYKNSDVVIKYDMFDDYDAFADTPIARIYEQLDKHYPGSKFILTVRDESKWIHSFRSQFEKGVPYSFDSKLHMDLYGTDNYDYDLCLNAYKAHIKNVKEYFAGREGDLLVIDITRGEGWGRLCKFLGRPVPDAEFPVKYQKHERDMSFRLKRLLLNPFKIPVYIMRRVKRLIEG